MRTRSFALALMTAAALLAGCAQTTMMGKNAGWGQDVAEPLRYVVELNNEDTGAEMTFDVFPPTTTIQVPAQFLTSGSQYQFAVGARAASANITFVELNFFTAP